MATTINLGAPSSIVGDANKGATISAQTATRLNTLSLAKNATREGSIVTACRLLNKLYQEQNAPDDELCKVEFTASAMTAHWNTSSGAMWRSGESIVVGGLHMWRKTTADGAYNQVPDSDVYWSIVNGVEGKMPFVADDGTVTGGLFIGWVRGALRSDPTHKADMLLFMGLGNVGSDGRYDSKPCPLARGLVSVKGRFGNSTLMNLIKSYPQLPMMIAERPALASLIISFPALVNSLIETDQRNVITQIAGSAAGFINSGIHCSADMRFRVIAKVTMTIANTYSTLCAGGGSTLSERMILRIGNNASGLFFDCRYTNTVRSYTLDDMQDQWGEYRFDATSYTALDKEDAIEAGMGSFSEDNAGYICIFGADYGTGGTLIDRNTRSGNTASIEALEIRKGNELHTIVPYIQNGEHGMLDLYDLSFHGNSYSSGVFNVTTEPK